MSGQRAQFGPGPLWLEVDGEVVSALAVADTPGARRTGLLGTSGIDGALWITKCPTVHMVGMKYPIDAITIDRHGVVLSVATLRPWVGLTLPRWRASATVEAAAGSASAWNITKGSVLRIHHDGSA